MAEPILLIAGLGNPGERYDATRHNAGFWLLDRIAARFGGTFRPESRFSGDACDALINNTKVRLLKPTTFMNRSGAAVGVLARFYKLEPAQVLVAHDELDLPAGTARLKSGGGPGGHNGLKDIIAHLGDRGFHRLRLGIGHPGQSHEVLNYVLKRPPATEQKLIDTAIDDALAEIEVIVGGDLARAMNRLHSHK